MPTSCHSRVAALLHLVNAERVPARVSPEELLDEVQLASKRADIRRLARSLGLDPDNDVADAVANCLVSLLADTRIDRNKRWKGYVHLGVRWALIDLHRSTRRHPTHSLDGEQRSFDPPAPGKTPSNEVGDRDVVQFVKDQLLPKRSDRDRRLIESRLDGLTFKQSARREGMSLSVAFRVWNQFVADAIELLGE